MAVLPARVICSRNLSGISAGDFEDDKEGKFTPKDPSGIVGQKPTIEGFIERSKAF